MPDVKLTPVVKLTLSCSHPRPLIKLAGQGQEVIRVEQAVRNVLDDPDVKTTTCHHCKLGSDALNRTETLPGRVTVLAGRLVGPLTPENDCAVWICPFPRVARLPLHVAA